MSGKLGAHCGTSESSCMYHMPGGGAMLVTGLHGAVIVLHSLDACSAVP